MPKPPQTMLGNTLPILPLEEWKRNYTEYTEKSLKAGEVLNCCGKSLNFSNCISDP